MAGMRMWCAWLLWGVLVSPVQGQEVSAPGQGEALRLFFDCQGSGCWDMDYFRREIPFVSWVRDRESSDVHVLVTSQTTGGGGRQYQLDFIGRSGFEGQEQTLSLNTLGDATDDEVRRALASRLRLGLGRYLAGTAGADRFRVVEDSPTPDATQGVPAAAAASGDAESDPWNFWVFTVRGNAYLNGESSYSSRNLNTTLSANRTTDAWKLNFSGRYSESLQTFELSETNTVESSREDWSASGLVVRSITPRFSVGSRLGAGRSTYLNEDFRWSVSPGVEFNLFPYSESSRRSLTLQALMNLRHWDYESPTIFGETAETRAAASVHAQLQFIQPWGRASFSLDHSRYLHDTDRWQAGLGGFFEVRLFKGFSVNMMGNYGWVRDQLYISSAGATEEEILLRQRAISTDFRYYTSFGISYRFGSIFNNVVNPRFGGGESGGMVIMF